MACLVEVAARITALSMHNLEDISHQEIQQHSRRTTRRRRKMHEIMPDVEIPRGGLIHGKVGGPP